jgi:hypothetical protein
LVAGSVGDENAVNQNGVVELAASKSVDRASRKNRWL